MRHRRPADQGRPCAADGASITGTPQRIAPHHRGGILEHLHRQHAYDVRRSAVLATDIDAGPRLVKPHAPDAVCRYGARFAAQVRRDSGMHVAEAVPCRAHPEAKVVILIEQEDARIEAAKSREHAAADQERRPRQDNGFAIGLRRSRATTGRRLEHRPLTKEDAAIRLDQPRTEHGSVWVCFRRRDQKRHGTRRDDYIRVDDQAQLGRGGVNAKVVAATVAFIARTVDHAGAVLARDARRAIGGIVVDHDGRHAFLGQGRKAPRQDGGAVVGHHDGRHGGWRGHRHHQPATLGSAGA